MTQINDLFEEAIARCGDLSSRAADSRAAIEELVDNARDLGEAAESAAEQLRARLDELQAQAAQVRDALTEATDDGCTRLAALREGGGEARARAEELQARVDQALGDLASQQQAAAEQAADDVEASAEHVRAFVERLGQLQEGLVAAADEAGEAVDGLNSAVDAARRDWQTQRDAVAAALEAFQSAVSTGAELYAKEIQDLLEHERTEVLVGELANTASIPAYNATMDVLRARFDEEPTARAATDLADAAAALDALENTCREQAEALAQWSQHVRAEAEASTGRAEALRPVAAAAAAVA
jgi:hypothetical protein